MMTIDQLRIVLPDGFGERGERIARLVGYELTGLRIDAPRVTAELIVPQVTVARDASDRDVARTIVSAIGGALAAPPEPAGLPANGER